MIEDVLGSDIYNFLENHEVPITVNFLKVPPAPGLHGQTTTFFKTSPEVVMYQAYNLPESTMRLPYTNENGNNRNVNLGSLKFVRTSFSRGVKIVTYDELKNERISSDKGISKFTVNVDAEKVPFRVYGDKLGHVYNALKNPADSFIWDIIEKSSQYFSPQGQGHELNNPSGVQANLFELMFQNNPNYGKKRVISPRFF